VLVVNLKDEDYPMRHDTKCVLLLSFALSVASCTDEKEPIQEIQSPELPVFQPVERLDQGVWSPCEDGKMGRDCE